MGANNETGRPWFQNSRHREILARDFMLLYAGVTTNTRPCWRLPNRRFEPKKYNLSKYKDLCGQKPIVSVTYENERISIKNSLPYKMCVTSLLCGPWADLWPSDGLYGKWYSKRFTVPENSWKRKAPWGWRESDGRKFVSRYEIMGYDLPDWLD